VRLSILAVCILLATQAFAVELFRCQGAARDGGTLEYVFETDRQDVPATATKERVAEIAADFMTVFYHIQIGALETQELRTTPLPFWLVAFSEAIQGQQSNSTSLWSCPMGRSLNPAWRNGCRQLNLDRGAFWVISDLWREIPFCRWRS
jgi:hypothetical protein